MGNHQVKTVEDVLRRLRGVRRMGPAMPGFDHVRTLMFILFVLVVLALSSVGTFLGSFTTLKGYCLCSVIGCCITIAPSVVSCLLALHILKKKVAAVRHYSCLFYPKILISLSITAFLLIILMWVVVLGGIVHSPFGTILSMSPVLALVQIKRDESADEDMIVAAMGKNRWDGNDESMRWSRARTLTKALVAVPMTIIVGSLVVGAFEFDVIDGELRGILLTSWYRMVYHILFYLAVVAAGLGVLPRDVTQRLSDRLL